MAVHYQGRSSLASAVEKDVWPLKSITVAKRSGGGHSEPEEIIFTCPNALQEGFTLLSAEDEDCMDMPLVCCSDFHTCLTGSLWSLTAQVNPVVIVHAVAHAVTHAVTTCLDMADPRGLHGCSVWSQQWRLNGTSLACAASSVSDSCGVCSRATRLWAVRWRAHLNA